MRTITTHTEIENARAGVKAFLEERGELDLTVRAVHDNSYGYGANDVMDKEDTSRQESGYSPASQSGIGGKGRGQGISEKVECEKEEGFFQRFVTTRRSAVYSTKGMVCCTQPLAARAGIRILEKGGNSADAAVAVAAALNVTEPMSTGIGGDLFALFHNGRTKAVRGLNGTGRSGSKMTYQAVRNALGMSDAMTTGAAAASMTGTQDDADSDGGSGGTNSSRVGVRFSSNIPSDSVHAITVPGAAAAWYDIIQRHGSGRLSMLDILAPAIKLAHEGWPVGEVASHSWKKWESLLLSSPNGRELLLYDTRSKCHRAPRAGEIMANPFLASTLLDFGRNGPLAFYEPGNRIADAILSVLRPLGSLLEPEDLAQHLQIGGSEETEPISFEFRGQGLGRTSVATNSTGRSSLVVWEHAPNSAGVVALVALALFEEFERSGKIGIFARNEFLGTAYVHAIVEALRIAFREAVRYVGDPEAGTQVHNRHAAMHILTRRSSPTTRGDGKTESRPSLLIERWARKFNPARAISGLEGAELAGRGSDTVYFSVVDSQGNGTSIVNSNFSEFGSGIVPPGTGFVLHNRGAGFALDPGHEGCLMPRRRPYHTLIPGLVTWGSRGDDDYEDVSSSEVPKESGDAAGRPGKQLMNTKEKEDKEEEGEKGSLHSLFGVKGGFVQPQGHLQVLLAQIVGGCNPQEALDCPRVCVGPGMPDPARKGIDGLDSQGAFGGDWTVNVERGMPEATIEGLRRLGHYVKVCEGWDRTVFGRGQIIRVNTDVVAGRKVYVGGTDGRGDGIAMPF